MNYDFNELGKIDKYVKRPKNQEPKLLKSKKLELGNTQLKSKYKTWNVSAQASSVSGIKNRGRSAKFIDYIARKEECLALYSEFTIFILIFSFQQEQHRRFYQYQRRAQRRLWVLSIIVLFRKAPLLFFFFTPQKKKKRKA